MPTFKPKTNKKIRISKKYSTTLDGKHKEFINDFIKDENDIIPRLKEEQNELKILLKDTTLPIEQIMEFNDRIREISETIKELKGKKINYFLDNSKFIFEYFENKKNINNNDVVKGHTSKNQILRDLFKVKKDANNAETMDENKNIVQKYLSNVDESFIDMNSFVRETDICQYCYKGEMIPLDDEGVLICNICSINIPYLIENEKPSYKEPPKEVCFYAYKKINHFKEILAQFQGKETTLIPTEVIETLKNQIKKERIDVKNLNYNDTKLLLKKLGYNKFYEHINFIKDKLGINPPIISQELEDTLCNFFIEIQSPYAKHCPDYRVNFLHYYYVLYKLFELL